MINIAKDKFKTIKENYHRDGYAIVENVFDDEECNKMKSHSEEFAEGPDFPVALNVHRKSDYFWSIISNKNIVNLIKFVQDADIDATNDQFLYKRAKTKYGRQSWTLHQDNSYPQAPKNSYIIVHVAVDRSERENGGLQYLKGSHIEDIIDFKNNKSWKEDSDNAGITRPGQTIVNEEQMLEKYKPVDIVFPKGSISLMHGNLIHGSHPNLTEDKDRNQYSMCYMNRGVEFFVGKSSPRIRKELY